jgi:CRISPR system Cascade subunit CasC
MTTIPARHIDVHILQTYPYSCLNRDDANSVKTQMYGGVERTRLSSQSQKRPIRLAVENELGQRSMRTRRLSERLAAHLREQYGWPAELAARAGDHVVAASSMDTGTPQEQTDAKNAKAKSAGPLNTRAVVYLPEAALTQLAELAHTHRGALEGGKDLTTLSSKDAAAATVLPNNEVDTILTSSNGVISLLGRMLAEVGGAGVDGAVHLAHAFTTHETETQLDYFSLVDDITALWNDTAGSAHMNTNEFSAGTFYRYLSLDLADLLRNLDGDQGAARELAGSLLTQTALAIQGAKHTSTAPFTLPDLVQITVREDRPCSYAAAFETPVPQGENGGYLDGSLTALNAHAEAVARFLGAAHAPRYHGYASLHSKDLRALGIHEDGIDELIAAALTHALPTGTAQ